MPSTKLDEWRQRLSHKFSGSRKSSKTNGVPKLSPNSHSFLLPEVHCNHNVKSKTTLSSSSSAAVVPNGRVSPHTEDVLTLSGNCGGTLVLRGGDSSVQHDSEKCRDCMNGNCSLILVTSNAAAKSTSTSPVINTTPTNMSNGRVMTSETTVVVTAGATSASIATSEDVSDFMANDNCNTMKHRKSTTTRSSGGDPYNASTSSCTETFPPHIKNVGNMTPDVYKSTSSVSSSSSSVTAAAAEAVSISSHDLSSTPLTCNGHLPTHDMTGGGMDGRDIMSQSQPAPSLYRILSDDLLTSTSSVTATAEVISKSSGDGGRPSLAMGTSSVINKYAPSRHSINGAGGGSASASFIAESKYSFGANNSRGGGGGGSRQKRASVYSNSSFGKSESYQKLNAIGEGSYATVFRGLSRLTNRIVALKEIQLSLEEGVPFTAIREASLLKMLKHVNIVTLHDIVYTKKSLTLVFEYLDTDLAQYMEDYPRGVHPHNIQIFLFQLLRGLAYCHDRKILHRDIKPQNILLNSSGELKLCDFGLARHKSFPIRTYSNEVVTLWYRPPDVLLGSTNYSSSLDMWGVGCIFGEMVQGRALFPGDKDVSDQLEQIWKMMGTPSVKTWPAITSYGKCYPEYFRVQYKRNKFRHTIRGLVQIAYAEKLLRSLLQFEPSGRLSAREAMAHPYFSDLSSSLHTLKDGDSLFVLPDIHLVDDRSVTTSSAATSSTATTAARNSKRRSTTTTTYDYKSLFPKTSYAHPPPPHSGAVSSVVSTAMSASVATAAASYGNGSVTRSSGQKSHNHQYYQQQQVQEDDEQRMYQSLYIPSNNATTSSNNSNTDQSFLNSNSSSRTNRSSMHSSRNGVLV